MPGVHLPDASYVDDAVVVRVTADVRGHSLIPQKSPKSISTGPIPVQAVKLVAQTAIIGVRLWVGRLMAEDEYH
jgi:hypothetical protein